VTNVTGAATATGGTSALTFIYTNTAGAGTGGGGTSTATIVVNVANVTGLATASGGTTSLAFTYATTGVAGGPASAGVLQLPQQARESVLSTFQAGHGFTGNGVGTFSDQATSVNGTQAFQIQTNGAAADSIATKTGLTPVSLVGRFVKLMMQVNGGGNLSYARLRLASGVIATDYAEATVYDNSVAGSALNNGLWNAQTVGIGDFTVTGLVDWSQITSAQLILQGHGCGRADPVQPAQRRPWSRHADREHLL
jgi:hypothetical protein